MSTTSASHYKKTSWTPHSICALHDAGEPATEADNKQGIQVCEQSFVNLLLVGSGGAFHFEACENSLSNSIIQCSQSLYLVWKLKPRNCSSLSMLYWIFFISRIVESIFLSQWVSLLLWAFYINY
jgi:hypothetical protein